MTAIIIISLIIFGVVLYMMRSNVYDKSRGDLELKYSRLVSLLLSTHDGIRLLKKDDNVVVLGGERRMYRGRIRTLVTIKEKRKVGGGDEVLIVYSIKGDPTCKDFDFRFLFSIQQALHDPDFVLMSINQKKKEHLINIFEI